MVRAEDIRTLLVSHDAPPPLSAARARELASGDSTFEDAASPKPAHLAHLRAHSGLVCASQLLERARASAAPEWTWRETAGRLCELAGGRAGANLSLAASLVRDAQLRGEGVAWIQARGSSFFPADLADCGVDLAALIVVRPPRPADLGLAAEWIARSGAFGLIVLDLTSLPFAPMAMQSRLLALAQKHDLGLVCLTEKSPQQASLSSLVSLRADTCLRRRSSPPVDSLADSLADSLPGALEGSLAICAAHDSESAARDRAQRSRVQTPHDDVPLGASGLASGLDPNDSNASPAAAGSEFDMAQLLATFECELNVAKDKRRSRPWRHCELRRGTPGLC